MSTTLKILAPYLPYAIEVEWKHGQARHYELTGLVAQTSTCYLEGKYSAFADDLLPVLRPFSALCQPLEDGTVPAREILLLIDKSRWTQLFRNYVKRLFIEDDSLLMEVDGSAFEIPTYNKLACLRSHIWGEDMRATVADYLRRNHFAAPINGRPLIEGVDFIAKAPAGPLTIQEGKI